MCAHDSIDYFFSETGENMLKFAIFVVHVLIGYLFIKFVSRLRKFFENTARFRAKSDENGT